MERNEMKWTDLKRMEKDAMYKSAKQVNELRKDVHEMTSKYK